MHLPRIKRTQSPHRETVSPVLSYYSEPAYLQHRKDVTRDLPPLPGGTRRRAQDEEDKEETLSQRSMPSMRSSLGHASKVKRSRGFGKRHAIPELRLPPVTKIHPDPRASLELRGTGYVRRSILPPIIKSTRTHEPLHQERPPGPAGYRPEKKAVGLTKQGDVPPGLPEKKAVGLTKQGDVPPGRPEKKTVGLTKQGDVPPGLLERKTVGLTKQGDVPPGLPERKTVGLTKQRDVPPGRPERKTVGLTKQRDVPPGLPEKKTVGLTKQRDVPPGRPEKKTVGLTKQGDVPPGLPERKTVGLTKQGDVPPGLPEKKTVGLTKSFNNQDILEVPVVTMSQIISDQPPPKTQRITLHSPVLQAVYPITPDNETQTRKAEEDRKALYPRVLSPTSTCAISNTIGPEKVYRFQPHLLRDYPPPYSSEWTDPKALTQGRTEWTEPMAPTQGRGEMLLIRLSITWSKAENSSNLRQPQSQSQLQRCPIRPLKPALRRLPISNTRRLRDWGRRGTTLGCLWEEEEEGCVPPPVPVQPGLLEPFTGFKEHLCRQVLHSPTPLAQLLEKASEGDHIDTQVDRQADSIDRQVDRLVDRQIMSQVPQVHTLQTPCSTLPAHTVQLSGSEGPGGALPRITMTRPTPSPKLPLLQSHTKNRHAA
ncbi:titin [Salvelinus fontinalis]|uniref:titin n=1 Tax=Salvelinus fontinalis TaxID=8038 RepID=UPI00248635FD|nr:titin [Salvelinus fontinalis]XP_055793202.1 titin [Salvelinus fontinalis]XP_055793203.1 titin [Salvelinus fontinalis]XP_055793204.1 titin [Salvelinus fontinalis]XP_055793205.1 titin [Salvelinus fontinalis]XP_055793207.1 titin [Salvelinus fontinalis]